MRDSFLMPEIMHVRYLVSVKILAYVSMSHPISQSETNSMYFYPKTFMFKNTLTVSSRLETLPAILDVPQHIQEDI